MSNFTDSAQTKQIDQREHNNDASSKRVIIRAQDPSSGDWVNISAFDNGDGTFSLSAASSIINGDGIPVSTKTVGTPIEAGDEGLIVNSVIHGLSSSGGGTYVDVKVTPSGALVTAGALGTSEYGINAISEDATYKYFWFEADDLDYYIMRKHKTTNVFTFTKGTGGYTSVYVDENSGPSGSPTWGTRGATW